MNLKQFADDHRAEVESIRNLEKFLEPESKSIQDIAAKITVQKELKRRVFRLWLVSVFER